MPCYEHHRHDSSLTFLTSPKTTTPPLPCCFRLPWTLGSAARGRMGRVTSRFSQSLADITSLNQDMRAYLRWQSRPFCLKGSGKLMTYPSSARF